MTSVSDQPKALFAATEEQVPKSAAPEDASRLLEGEERTQRDEKDRGISHEAGQRAAEIGKGIRERLTIEPGPNRFFGDVKRKEQNRENQRLAEHDPNEC
jgi:hypothetical protein